MEATPRTSNAKNYEDSTRQYDIFGDDNDNQNPFQLSGEIVGPTCESPPQEPTDIIDKTTKDQRTKKAVHDTFGYGDDDHDVHPDLLFEQEGMITVSSWEDLDELVERINKTYFYVVTGGIGHVAYLDHDPVFDRRAIYDMTPHTFHQFYASRQVKLMITDEQREKPKHEPLTKIWMEHPNRRQYKGIVFAPDQTIPRDRFNLWQDFRQDAREGDCRPFLDFVFEVICNRNATYCRYVLAWMADAVQNITATDKPGVALVFRGPRGAGKGFYSRNFGSLFGQYFVHVTNPDHITGRFNRQLQDCLLLFADEIAGTRKNMGILQGLITEPTIQVEIKGQDAFQAVNYMRVVVASNFEWVVPAGPNERRWAVFDVSDCHMQDAAYFARLDALMRNGGREALLYYLLNYDYSGIDLRRIPRTSALADQLISTMDSIEAYWYSLLQKGTYPGPLAGEAEWGSILMIKDVIYQDYIETCEKRKSFIRNETAFWTKVRKLCPRLRDVRPTTIGHKRGFEAPTLEEARALFGKFFGQDFRWEEEAGA